MAGLLDAVFNNVPFMASTPSPDHDFWYSPVGATTSAGVRITQESALAIGAVYACVDKLAKAFKTSPCHLNRQLPEDAEGRPTGIRRATDHWLWPLLHDQPNERQTAPEFWAWVRASLALRGAFYARKIFGAGDEVIAVDPFHPDDVETKILPNRKRGFLVRRPTGGPKEPLVQEEVFHCIALSLDGGKTPVSVLKYAAATLGRTVAVEDYASRTFTQGALHRLVVSHPGTLGSKAHDNLKKSISERTSGSANWHQPLILEENMQVKEMSMTPEDTQMLLSRRFSVADVARFFDVPLVMINETDRSTSWGSGIEQLMQGFVTWACLPSCRDVEASIKRDLIPERERDRLSAKFKLDALLRADTATRFQAHATGITTGFKSENEVRLDEDLNPVAGLWDPRRSANMDRGGDPKAPRPERRASPPADDDDGLEARAQAIAMSNAQRVVRKEIATIRTQAERRQGEDWRRWAAEFYGKHVDVLVEALCLTETQARRYGADHCGALLEHGVAVLEDWERDAPSVLAAMALGLA